MSRFNLSTSTSLLDHRAPSITLLHETSQASFDTFEHSKHQLHKLSVYFVFSNATFVKLHVPVYANLIRTEHMGTINFGPFKRSFLINDFCIKKNQNKLLCLLLVQIILLSFSLEPRSHLTGIHRISHSVYLSSHPGIKIKNKTTTVRHKYLYLKVAENIWLFSQILRSR